MHDNSNETRIESINRMIMEIACGNFDYKIERSDRNDDLEALVVMINLMAEEMKESFVHRGYLKNTSNSIAGMSFILDHDLTIQAFNPGVTRVLFFDAHELEGKPLTDFLTRESKIVWEALKPRLDDFDGTVELFFKTKQSLVVPVCCMVSTLFNHSKHQRNILVTVIETISGNTKEVEEDLGDTIEHNKKNDRSPGGGESKVRISLRDADVRKIGEAREHILQRLKDDLSLKELAHASGVNEFKLKHGFKLLYGATVFRFLMEERLKKASLLLQNTDMPLKQISEITGFKSFSHFSKAFKNRFGYCPSELKRASRQN